MRVIFIALLALCVSVISCSRAFVFKVFNNSGQDLIILSYDGKLVPHEFPVAAGSTVDVQFPTKLSIIHSGNEWKYDLPRLDKTYEYTRASGVRVQDIQIETSGFIYLLLPKTKEAVHQFPAQPDGFPIMPK